MTVPANRRSPLQARSNKTVEEILDAASSLLGKLPFEQITTSRIAEQAGISVGALYRFYSDRQEIFDAIAVRELDAFRAEIERAFSARQLIFSPRKSLGRVLDAYVDFLESRPHFRELSLGNHISDWTRESQSDPETGPGGILGDLLVKKCGWRPGKEAAVADPDRGRGGRPRDRVRLQAGVAGSAASGVERVEGNADPVPAALIRLISV